MFDKRVFYINLFYSIFIVILFTLPPLMGEVLNINNEVIIKLEEVSARIFLPISIIMLTLFNIHNDKKINGDRNKNIHIFGYFLFLPFIVLSSIKVIITHYY